MVGKVSQSDWGGGLWRSGGRDRVPDNAAGELQSLLLGDDGLPFGRGGGLRKSNAAVGSAGLGWVWAGALAGGLRTVFQTLETDARFVVLDSDDATPVVLRTDVANTVSGPFRPAVAGGVAMVLVHGGATFYAGSRKTGAAQVYNTGTVDVTNGSMAVVGHGTSWLANVDAGMMFDRAGVVPTPVASIQSNTALTLARPYLGGTAAGSAYTLGTFFQRGTTVPPSSQHKVWGAVANRWVQLVGNILYFSDILDPNTWQTTNNHEFPHSGIAVGALRDVLLVFTQGGVWAVSGLAYDLIDALGNPQHRKELVNADLIAWGHEGIASWGGALVVPCLDGVWLMDSLSAPTRISRPVDDLYLSYVRAGYKPGVGEVFDGHYLLPILTSGNVWVDSLVCKFAAGRTGPGFAWSRAAGTDAQVSGFAERPSSPPVLLGSSLASSSRVLDLTAFFAPAGGNKLDADGSTRQAVWESREYAPTDLPTTFRRVRVWYELTDAASDNPTVEFAYARDSDTGYTVVAGSGGTVQGSGTQAGGESDGTRYAQWPVNKSARGMRFRLRTVGPWAGFKVRAVELVVEQAGGV